MTSGSRTSFPLYLFATGQWVQLRSSGAKWPEARTGSGGVFEFATGQWQNGSSQRRAVMAQKDTANGDPDRQVTDSGSKPEHTTPFLIFVHGELETRTPEAVKLSFDLGLTSTNLGEQSRILYWADLFQQALRESSELLASAGNEVRTGVSWLSESVERVQHQLVSLLRNNAEFSEKICERFRSLTRNLRGRRVVIVLHGYAISLCVKLRLAQFLGDSPTTCVALAPPPDWRPDAAGRMPESFELVQIVPTSDIPFPVIEGVETHRILEMGEFWYQTPFQTHLENKRVRARISPCLGAGFSDHVREFVVAKDVASRAAHYSRKQRVLIELDFDSNRHDLDHARSRILAAIEEVTSGIEAEIDEHRRYVSASLTGDQIWSLRERHRDLGISRIWTNSPKRKLTHVSSSRLQVIAARFSHGATGNGVNWAVLDTGVQSNHPHFWTHGNIVSSLDCTVRGKRPVELKGSEDPDGHGTHVCGIIAGCRPQELAQLPDYTGMAPQARIHSYKVLDDHGDGDDGFTIKALDHISAINEAAGRLVIHGINISLGGPFDVEVFGCGHSPICRELRRLWRQGVLICIAAGNEGVISIHDAADEQPFVVNADLTIGDPANLEEAICVGSVHKEAPMIHGVSYFSSRGPTADGRAKPDVVAPGEKIFSAASNFIPGNPASYYASLSGTSMACPHVSGLLAAFLSVRKEYLGRPDEVKSILKRTAITLNRDAYHQGAGLPNVLDMIRTT